MAVSEDTHDLLDALEVVTNLEEGTLLDLESACEEENLELSRSNHARDPAPRRWTLLVDRAGRSSPPVNRLEDLRP